MNQFTNTNSPDPPLEHPLTLAHTYLAALTLAGRHCLISPFKLQDLSQQLEDATVFDLPFSLAPDDTVLLRVCLSHSLDVMESGHEVIGMPDLLEALKPERIRTALESLAKTTP